MLPSRRSLLRYRSFSRWENCPSGGGSAMGDLLGETLAADAPRGLGAAMAGGKGPLATVAA